MYQIGAAILFYIHDFEVQQAKRRGKDTNTKKQKKYGNDGMCRCH
jgi:hypothetical protein